MLIAFIAAALAGTGLELRQLAPLQDTELSARLEITDAALRDRVTAGSLEIEAALDQGRLEEVQLSTLAGGSAPLTTLFAVDQSGSFRRYSAEAFELARHYAESRSIEREAMGLMLFGLEARHYPNTADQEQMIRHLGEAAKLGSRQKETRLAEFVRQGVHRLAQENPSSARGHRQLILFTDAGEESDTWSVDEVAQTANAAGVFVHVVVFYKRNTGSVAGRLDDMSRLTALTGGSYIQVDAVDSAKIEIAEVASRVLGLADLHGRVCGLSATPAITLSIRDDGGRLAWTGPHALQGASEATRSRCAPAGLPKPAPLGGAEGGDVSGAGSAAGGACLLAMLVVLSLLGVSAAFVLHSVRNKPQAAPPLAPPSPPAEPPRSSESRGRSRPHKSPHKSGLPDALPETQLVVVRGSGVEGTRWRFTGRKLQLGAIEDPENDVVVNLPQVSSHHARFELYPSGDVFVTDLDSSNGTWVGGTRLPPATRTRIPDGGEVALSTELVLQVQQPGPGKDHS